MSAIVTATSGAAPAITDARDGPRLAHREHEEELRAAGREQTRRAGTARARRPTRGRSAQPPRTCRTR